LKEWNREAKSKLSYSNLLYILVFFLMCGMLVMICTTFSLHWIVKIVYTHYNILRFRQRQKTVV
jgi:hypothetical protein